jgi:nucleoside-diphosphate-sugar epimerase
MTILITGGRGKTSSQLANLLAQAEISFIHASHTPSVINENGQQCHFDWLDQTTWANSIPQNSDVHAVYLVGPPLLDTVAPMKSFIEFAKARGVRRFVLLSASVVPMGGPAMGQVHAFLATLGVDYTVLRPTWFMGMPVMVTPYMNPHEYYFAANSIQKTSLINTLGVICGREIQYIRRQETAKFRLWRRLISRLLHFTL